MKPLVTVIGLCHNHKSFVREAIESVLKQTYDNIRIILVDDASTDGSQQELAAIASENVSVELMLLPQNVGNCKAFNQALMGATGDYVIDFATDDVMKPFHIERLVEHFQKLDESYGVVFTDATYIDRNGKILRTHYDDLLQRKRIDSIPQGDVFRKVVTTYFIPGPTMMIRKKVLDELGGYDETLAYEDFDFWIRSSRKYKYSFLSENQMLIRKLSTSMSANAYAQGDRQLHSTYLICRKAKEFCRDEEDQKALKARVLYEFRQAVLAEKRGEAILFSDLLSELGATGFQFYLLNLANNLPLPWRWVRSVYYRLKYS